MDSKETLQRLKGKARIFCRERGWDKSNDAKEISIGISTEAAELLEHFRFKKGEEIARTMGDADERREISHELGDILYCLLAFSDMYGIDISDAFEEKLGITAKRYPAARNGNSKNAVTYHGLKPVASFQSGRNGSLLYGLKPVASATRGKSVKKREKPYSKKSKK